MFEKADCWILAEGLLKERPRLMAARGQLPRSHLVSGCLSSREGVVGRKFIEMKDG